MIMLSVIEICLSSERLVLSKKIFLINMRQLRLDFFVPKKPKSVYSTDLGFVLRTAVAQRIEHLFDSKVGRRFESYQRYAH